MDTRRNWPVIGGVALLVLAAVVLAVAAVAYLAGDSELETAAAECASDGQPVVGDDGNTLTVASSGKEAAGNATAVSSCVLIELGAPLSVLSKVEGTTAMMGRQTDSWDDYQATWTYHPDNGLELIVEAD